MTSHELYVMFRNRLPIVKSKKFLKATKEIYPHMDLHHILGSIQKTKLNDFLVCPMPHEVHMKIENGIAVDGYSFEEQLLTAINILLEYTKYLEDEK